MPAITQVKIRRGTSAQWAATNPVLSAGESGWDSTLSKLKIGDGTATWSALPFFLDTALSAKAPTASPTFTGTVSGVTKAHVGLSNVDNTADSAKPVSTAQQTALNLKANAANPAFTGTPTGLAKAHVGLGNVDNTSDASKPVSTAQQTALNGKVNNSEKGAANGVATLDATGKVPVSQIPGAQIPSFSGNFVDRPAADAVVNGSVYYSIDTVEIYRSNGTFWQLVNGAGYAASAEITAQWTTNAVDLVDIPGLATAFVAGSGNTKITLSGEASHSTADGRIFLVIEINGTDYGHVALHFSAPDRYKTFSRTVMARNLVPGSYNTIKVRGMVHYATGGFGRLDAEPYNPTLLLVEAL